MMALRWQLHHPASPPRFAGVKPGKLLVLGFNVPPADLDEFRPVQSLLIVNCYLLIALCIHTKKAQHHDATLFCVQNRLRFGVFGAV